MLIEEMNASGLLYVSSKYGGVSSIQKGGGDQYNTNFFRSIRLQMGDDKLTQPFAQHVWTHACIKAISTAIMSVPFVVIKEKASAGGRFKKIQRKIRAMKTEHRYRIPLEFLETKGMEIIDSGPLYDTFDHVNPFFSRAQLWEATSIYQSLYGDCFWILENGNDEPIKSPSEWPKEIYPKSGNLFKPVLSKDRRLEKWEILEGTALGKTYELWQVVHFYNFNPYNPIDGLATYDVVKSSARQDFQASQYNEALLANGGEPGGILKIKTTPAVEIRKQILSTFEDRHKGPGNAGKTALLMGDADYDRTPTTPKDMEYIESRKWNRDETFAGFRVPKQMASIYDAINYATAKIELRQFWENVVIPYLVYFEDTLNSKLFSKAKEAQGYYCMFDLASVDALREDLESKAKVAETFSKIGIPTADIIDNLELTFEKRPWMSQWWLPMSMVPVGEAGKQEPEADPEKPEDEDGEEGEASMSPLREKLASSIAKCEKALDKEKHWKLYVAKVLDPVEKPFRSKIKAYWNELRGHQLSLWANGTKSVRAMPSEGELVNLLFNNQDWQEKLKSLSFPYFENVAELSLEQAASELGTAVWNIEDPRVVAVMNEKANKIKDITDRFWKSLRSSLAEGISANETVAELSVRIKNKFNMAASSSRTMTIARTETAQAAGTVRFMVFKQEGVKSMEWSTSMDEHVREDHQILGGVGPQPTGHNYMIDVSKPGHLLYPGDMGGPADQVINCRCVLLPAT